MYAAGLWCFVVTVDVAQAMLWDVWHNSCFITTRRNVPTNHQELRTHTSLQTTLDSCSAAMFCKTSMSWTSTSHAVVAPVIHRGYFVCLLQEVRVARTCAHLWLFGDSERIGDTFGPVARNPSQYSSCWSPRSACRAARSSGDAENASQCFIFAMPRSRPLALKSPAIRLASSNSASEGTIFSRRDTVERVDKDERRKHLNRTRLAIK